MKGEFTRVGDGAAELGSLLGAREERHLRGVRVEWLDCVADRRTIEEALRKIPESSDWPGLFEVLLEPRGTEKRVAIVLDREGLMGVVLLRSTGYSSWEPATQWIVPGFLSPVRSGCAQTVLEALHMRLDVGWWRQPEPPPSGPRIRIYQQKERHQIDCTKDFDAYWKQVGHLNTVRQARRRCKDFLLKVDPEGGAEWTIRNCEQKWRSDPRTPEPRLEDRVAAAKFLEQLGRHHTLVLFDGDLKIAGATCLIHKGSVVYHNPYRAPEYDHHGVGTHILESLFRWSARSGYRDIDMGTGFKYKERWAPASGEYTYWLTVSPPKKYAALRRLVRRLIR
jgi:hypothetical protein